MGAHCPAYAERAQTVDPDDDGCSSVKEVVDGLSANGLRARAFISPTRAVPRELCILLVRSEHDSTSPDHFVVIEPKGEKWMLYVPPIGAQWATESEIRERWDGHAIILASRESAVSVWGAAAGLATLFIFGTAVGAIGSDLWRRTKRS
jgi:hypothetical protein